MKRLFVTAISVARIRKKMNRATKKKKIPPPSPDDRLENSPSAAKMKKTHAVIVNSFDNFVVYVAYSSASRLRAT